MNGPGLNTHAVTDRSINQIRSGVAHPVIAAALATTLFTGIPPEAMVYSQLSVDADKIQMMWRPRKNTLLSAVTVTAPKTATTAVFHVPLPARPLLRAARHFAHEVLVKPGRRLFMAALTTTDIVTAAATASQLALPDPLSALASVWQTRVSCAPIDAPAPHADSCSEPDWVMLADTVGRKTTSSAGHRGHGEHPAVAADDRSFGRRPLTTDSAAGVLQLIADHFAAVPAVQRSRQNTARSWELVRRELAFYPRDPNGDVAGALAPHPDVLFALRLTTNPPEMALPTRPSVVHRDQ